MVATVYGSGFKADGPGKQNVSPESYAIMKISRAVPEPAISLEDINYHELKKCKQTRDQCGRD